LIPLKNEGGRWYAVVCQSRSWTKSLVSNHAVIVIVVDHGDPLFDPVFWVYSFSRLLAAQWGEEQEDNQRREGSRWEGER
jgi:hypothetical protein